MDSYNFTIPEDYRIEHVDLPVPILRDAISADTLDSQGVLKSSKKRVRKECALRLLVVAYFLASASNDKDPAGYIHSVPLSKLQKMIHVKTKATVIAALNHLQDRGYLTWKFDSASSNILDVYSERTINVKIPFFSQMYKKNYGGFRKMPSSWMNAFLSCDTPSEMRIMILACLNSYSSDDKHDNCSFEDRIPNMRRQLFRTARRRDLLQSMSKLKEVIHFVTKDLMISFRMDNLYSLSHLREATREKILRELNQFEDEYAKATLDEPIDWVTNKYHSILSGISHLPAYFNGGGNPLNPRDLSQSWNIFDDESKEEFVKMTFTYGLERTINGLISFLRTYSYHQTNEGKFFYKKRDEFFKILNKIICNPGT